MPGWLTCPVLPVLQLGLHVYATMREWGVPPDVRSVGWMLRLYVRAGQVDQVRASQHSFVLL